jgi:hypothetical protein
MYGTPIMEAGPDVGGENVDDRVPDGTRYTFDWRRAEQAAAGRYLIRRRLRSGVIRWVLLAIWLFLLVSAVFTVLLVVAGAPGDALRIGALTATCGLLLAFLPNVAGWIQSRVMARTDPNVSHPITFEIGRDALRVILETHTSELKWSGVPEVGEVDGLILIHYSSLAAYYLPTRAVGSDVAVHDLLERLRAKTAPSDVNPRP